MPLPLNQSEIKALFGQTPADAVAYLQRKGLRLSWDWQDTLDQAHARAFTVAKVARIDVLRSIKRGLDKALEGGQTQAQFVKDLKPNLQNMGWWGKQVIVDRAGVAEVAQLGSPRRLATIYRTNMQSAYMAGHYKAAVEGAATHPYWQWVAILDGKTRAAHRALEGKVFALNDPFTNVGWPPLGYNCRCRTRPLSRSALKKLGIRPTDTRGTLQSREIDLGVDKRTGEVRKTKVQGFYANEGGRKVWLGPDAGFNSNPATSQLMDDHLVRRAQQLHQSAGASPAKALRQVQHILLKPQRTKAWQSFVAAAIDFARPQRQRMAAGVLQADEMVFVAAQGLPAPNPIIFVEDNLIVGRKARRHAQKGDALSREDWLALPALLAAPQAVYWDVEHKALIYALRQAEEQGVSIAAVHFTDRGALQHHQPVAATVYRQPVQTLSAYVASGRYVEIPPAAPESNR